MLFLTFITLISGAVAASTPVATSAIVSTITSTYLSTTSSVIGSSTSNLPGTSTSCSTSGSKTVCVIDGVVATVVSIYDSDAITLTTKGVSTVGYTTIYSNLPDASTTTISKSNTPILVPTTSTSSTITSTSKPQTSVSSQSATTTVQQASTILQSTLNSRTTSSSSADQTTASQTAASALTSTVASASPSANTETNSASTAPNQSSSLGRNVGIAVVIGVAIVLLGFAAMFYVRRKQRTSRSLLNRGDEEKVNEIVIHSKPSTGHQSTIYEVQTPQAPPMSRQSNRGPPDAYELQATGRRTKSTRSIRSMKSVRSIRSARSVRSMRSLSGRSTHGLGHDRGQSEEIMWPMPPTHYTGPHAGDNVTYYSSTGSGAG